MLVLFLLAGDYANLVYRNTFARCLSRMLLSKEGATLCPVTAVLLDLQTVHPLGRERFGELSIGTVALSFGDSTVNQNSVDSGPYLLKLAYSVLARDFLLFIFVLGRRLDLFSLDCLVCWFSVSRGVRLGCLLTARDFFQTCFVRLLDSKFLKTASLDLINDYWVTLEHLSGKG